MFPAEPGVFSSAPVVPSLPKTSFSLDFSSFAVFSYSEVNENIGLVFYNELLLMFLLANVGSLNEPSPLEVMPKPFTFDQICNLLLGVVF